MKDPKVKNRKAVFGPCRLSYVHLLEKHSFEGSSEDGKYSVSILIPKKEKATVDAIKEAIANAQKEYADAKWGGKAPKKLSLPLGDGDERDDEAYAGHWYINAKSNTKPGVVDIEKDPNRLGLAHVCICADTREQLNTIIERFKKDGYRIQYEPSKPDGPGEVRAVTFEDIVIEVNYGY